MKDLEYFKKKQAEADAEIAKLSGNLVKLQQERDALEEQINAAIDAGELDKVDRLTAKETELDNRIKAAEKVIDRKKATSLFSREEIQSANNSEMDKYQRKYDDLIRDAEKIKQQYLAKLLDAFSVKDKAEEAYHGYLSLAGEDISQPWIGDNILGYNRLNIGKIVLTDEDMDKLEQIRPEAAGIYREAVVRPHVELGFR